MQETALKLSDGWMCRGVALKCVGPLGKEGGVADGRFRPLEEPSAKVVLLKMLYK